MRAVAGNCDLTGHRNRGARFLVVDDVIDCHGVNRDRRACRIRRRRGARCSHCLASGGVGHHDTDADLLGHPVDHQVAHGHVLDRVREVARHGTLIVVAINRQCDDFAGIDRAIGLAPNRTRDGGGRNQDFLVVNDVVGGNRVDADMRCKRIGADRAGYAGTVGAARNVMTANRGRDRLILNCAAQHVDAVVAVGVHRAGANHRAANRQRDHVVQVRIAAHAASDCHLLVGFNVVDDVICGNRIDRDSGAGCICANSMILAGAVGAAGRVHAADRGRNGLPGYRVARNGDAVVTAGVHRAGADLGRADHQRDSVARLGVAADVAADRDLLVHFDVVDDVVGSDRVDRDGGAGGI